MKFLCLKCDSRMALRETNNGKKEGALSIVFACPSCGDEIAMQTNSGETQVVASLGLEIGGEPVTAPHPSTENGDFSKCPFSGVAKETISETSNTTGQDLSWAPEAETRLEKIPEFLRPMVKTSIEQFAREQGHSQITEAVLTAAREQFGL